ncbi:MAG: rod-binding protein [Leptospirales bacterium]
MIDPAGSSSPVAVISKEAGTPEDRQFEKAARKFEEMVIGILVHEMWKSVPKEGIVRQSTGMDVAQDMFQRELSREMSRAGGLGLARDIVEQSRQMGVGMADPGLFTLPGPMQQGDLPDPRKGIDFQA